MLTELSSILISLGFALIYPALSLAGPLTEAHVTKIINVVKLTDPASGDRDAKLDDVVHGDLALTTGIKSRSELLFQDNTLTRLGPESYFSFKGGTREMTLQKGTLLLQVPKGLGGAKIHTASVTAAITGTTIMMEYVPQKAIKVLVLEGTLRLSMNGRFGDSLLLTPGKMVIMSPTAKRVPDPVTIDLKKVVQTSTLVNMQSKHGKQASADTASLPSMSLIEKEINQQQAGKDAHRVADTNLVILGKGTNVVIGSDELIADLTARTNVLKTDLAEIPPPVPVTTPAPTPAPTPIVAPTPNLNPPPSGTPPPPPPGSYVIDNTTAINAPNVPNAGPTIVTQGVTTSGVIYHNVTTNGSPAGFLFGAASPFDNQLNFDNDFLQDFGTTAVFTFDSLQLSGGITFATGGGPNGVALVGDNGITNTAGTVTLGGINNILFATKSGSIVLDSGLTFNSSADGSKPSLVEFYARGGDLNIGSIFNLGHSTLEFAAENNAIFSGGTITARNLDVTGLQTIQFDTNANLSSLFQLNGGDVELGGAVTTNAGFLYGSSATINGSLQAQNLTSVVTGDYILSNTASETTSADTSITAGGNIALDGTLGSHKLFLTATNAITLDGVITTTDGLTATSATGAIDGTLMVKQANFQTGGNFVLGGSGTIAATNDSTINAGGLVQLDGAINSPNANFKITGVGTALNPAIIVNGSQTAESLDFEATGDFLLNGTGAINTSGDSKINATGGDITLDGAIATGNLTMGATSDVDINQALSANHLTISGQTENIAGAITAHDVDLQPTADLDLTAAGSFNLSGHLHITAGGSITLDGVTNASNDVQLNASDALTLNGAVTTNSNFNAQANSIAINDNIIAQSITFQTQTLSLANGAILTSNHDIQVNNAASMILDGAINATNNLNLTATGDVEIGGSAQAGNATIHSGTFTLNGSLTAPTVNLQLAVGLSAGAAGSLVSAQNLSITVPTAYTFNTTDATITRFDPTNLSSLTIHAPSIVLPDNLTATNSVTLNTTSLAPLSTNTLSINAPNISFQAGTMMNGASGTPVVAPGNGLNLTLTTNDFNLNSALSLNGGDGDITVTDAGGDGGQLNITGHNITLNAPVNATSGQNSNNSLTGGNGGTVNVTGSNTINLNNKIEVSSNDGGRRKSASGGHININGTATGGTAINVTSSAQLLALLNAAAPGPGGSIKFTSAGGAINMSGTAQADRGTIEITNNGTTGGQINLTSATLMADTIKVGALGTNGQLNIGGGTISADSLIKLYAGGSNGTVDFTDNVTLSGSSAKIIAANTVIINNGKTVMILGPSAVDVFTNHPHYTGFGGDATTTGTFAGKGAATHPLSGAPSY